MATTVTLPSVSDFPGLTPCQQRRVQHAIDTVLAPHEQQHVKAFRRYNGTTRRAFDLTVCRDQFDSAIQSMFEAEERGAPCVRPGCQRCPGSLPLRRGPGLRRGDRWRRWWASARPAAMARAETPAPETPATEEAATATQTSELAREEQTA